MKEQQVELNDWLYYMGSTAGGHDTGEGYWIKGVIGQVQEIHFDGQISLYNIQNAPQMKAGSNRAIAFRKATPEEIPGYVNSLTYEIY